MGTFRCLLLVALLLQQNPPARAQQSKVRCPGETTIDMRYCADLSLRQSTDQLRHKFSRPVLQQWNGAATAVCSQAYSAYREGTIFPQLILGCNDNLNRALLKELRGLQ